jgi:hypothetical protein
MTADTHRVQACSPAKLAVLVDGQEIQIEAPDDRVSRHDLIAEKLLPGGDLHVCWMKGRACLCPARLSSDPSVTCGYQWDEATVEQSTPAPEEER